MPIDHSTIGPLGIRLETAGPTTAFSTVIVTPPAVARSVDLSNPDGIIRISEASHTSEGFVATEYFAVPSGSGYTLQLQTEEEVRGARSFAIATAATTHTVGFSYRTSVP